MMKLKQLFFFMMAAFFLASCQKDLNVIEDESEELLASSFSPSDELKMKFSKALSKAVLQSTELRALIKNEALKRVNNDYEVLYQMIKDKKLSDKTVSELISEYADPEIDFSRIEESLPLLTILVPSLPDFGPGNWDPTDQIPQIAVRMENDNVVPIFDNGGNMSFVPNNSVPAFPVLVVKQNERIRVSEENNLKSANIISSDGLKGFEFIDEAFNGLLNKEKGARVSRSSTIEIPQMVIDAYNSGVEWQRDNVYYGLTPTNTVGPCKHGIYEYLTSFEFVGGDWYHKISDQSGDPFITSNDLWTEGDFEFKLIVLLSAKNGVGSTVELLFSARGEDLMKPSYRKSYGQRRSSGTGLYRGDSSRRSSGRGSSGSDRGSSGSGRSSEEWPHTTTNYYKVTDIVSKPYNPNLQIVEWDLKEYGASWKITVLEVDDSQEITTTQKVATEFATNFEISGGEEKKVGLKWGASLKETRTSTFSVTTKMESDHFFDAILNFRDPIITGVTRNRRTGVPNGYKLNKIPVGSYLEMTIMPKVKY